VIIRDGTVRLLIDQTQPHEPHKMSHAMATVLLAVA
jgi:hypothetical protein